MRWACALVLAAVVAAQPANPPGVPVEANQVGYPDITQDGAALLAQRITAYCDPAYMVAAVPGGDPTIVAVQYGATIAWVTACEGCAPGSYVPWFGVVAASSYAWPTWVMPAPWAVPGYDTWCLSPAATWTGLPLGVLAVPASGEMTGWGPGELWVIAWTVPTSPYVLGLRVCAQWLRVDATGAYLSDLWCVRIL